jgi:hypothetical protein
MSFIAFLVMCLPFSAMVAGVVLIFSGDAETTIRWWVGTYGALAVLGALAALFGKSDEERLDESADITNLAYDIRSIFGAAAQNEFLQTVSTPSQPGKNTNECRFARGHNRKTMAAVAQEIRQKYKPIPEWKPKFDIFG